MSKINQPLGQSGPRLPIFFYKYMQQYSGCARPPSLWYSLDRGCRPSALQVHATSQDLVTQGLHTFLINPTQSVCPRSTSHLDRSCPSSFTSTCGSAGAGDTGAVRPSCSSCQSGASVQSTPRRVCQYKAGAGRFVMMTATLLVAPTHSSSL
jgi:hypothetical protein